MDNKAEVILQSYATTHLEALDEVHKKVRSTFFNWFVICASCLGSLTYGYSTAIISSTIGQPGWFANFGLVADSTVAGYAHTTDVIAATNGIYSAGGTIGCILVMWTAQALGRKRSIQIGALIEVFGAALQAGCRKSDLSMWYSARFFAGMGIGMLVAIVPIYVGEVAKPMSRGKEVGFHSVFLICGYAGSAYIGYGTYHATNLDLNWRLPLAILLLFPLSLLGISPFLPFSPRWLIQRGRLEEAWKVVQRVHIPSDERSKPHYCDALPLPTGNGPKTENACQEELLARAEFLQMVAHINKEKKASGGQGLSRLFTRASYRRRMIIGFMTQFGAECAGPLVIATYQVLIYQNLGQTGSMPLLLTAIYLTTAIPYNLIGALLIDRLGRRFFFLVGIAGCGLTTAVEAALTAKYASTTNKIGNGFAILFIFLYLFFQATFIDTSMYIYSAEIFPMDIRSYGAGFAALGQFVGTIIMLQTAPIGFQNIGWKYYLVIIIWCVFFWIAIYRYWPETARLSLEEIGRVFKDEVDEDASVGTDSSDKSEEKISSPTHSQSG